MSKLVYHVMEATKASQYKKGDILNRQEYSHQFAGEKKINVERIFEKVRSDKYPCYPSRLCSLFVFPSIGIAYNYLLMKKAESVILSLKIDDPIYWFNMRDFTLTGVGYGDAIIEAEKYWSNGKKKLEDDIILNDNISIEGLTTGEAKILAIDGFNDLT